MNSTHLLRFLLVVLVLGGILMSCDNVIRVKDTQEKVGLKESDLRKGTLYRGIETCEEGEALAKKDLAAGKINYIFGGFGSGQTLAKNLEKMYGIEVIRLEGIIEKPNRCYNDIMYLEIQKKFGQDAFNRASE